MGTQKELSDSYCFRYYMPITHSADDQKEHTHSHTLEIAVYIRLLSGFHGRNLEKFGEIEQFSQAVLRRYHGQYLNDLPEFGGDASIEHIGDVLYRIMEQQLLREQLLVERLEIGENPLRLYVVSTYL